MTHSVLRLILLIAGIALVVAAVTCAVVATANTNMIGGADFPTFLFIFSRYRGGLYSLLTGIGLLLILISLLIRPRKPRA